jgi:hypothetical protein
LQQSCDGGASRIQADLLAGHRQVTGFVNDALREISALTFTLKNKKCGRLKELKNCHTFDMSLPRCDIMHRSLPMALTK